MLLCSILGLCHTALLRLSFSHWENWPLLLTASRSYLFYFLNPFNACYQLVSCLQYMVFPELGYNHHCPDFTLSPRCVSFIWCFCSSFPASLLTFRYHQHLDTLNYTWNYVMLLLEKGIHRTTKLAQRAQPHDWIRFHSFIASTFNSLSTG